MSEGALCVAGVIPAHVYSCAATRGNGGAARGAAVRIAILRLTRALQSPELSSLAQSATRSAQERKREMARVIEATSRAAEARERCVAEMAALKAQADREQAAFESEWQRLGATIDQDRRNRDLLRQRDMEERNRKTQEARPARVPCGLRTACMRPAARAVRRVRWRRWLRAWRARAAAEEPRGGADGQGGGARQGGAARARAGRRRREHGPRAAAR